MTIEELYDKINEIAVDLQRNYFQNERFFDQIKGAESLDNATGWTYELGCIADGYITGERAEKELDWLIDTFHSVAYLMECHGAGETGSARGINHNTQYTWAISKHAENLLREFKREGGLKNG